MNKASPNYQEGISGAPYNHGMNTSHNPTNHFFNDKDRIIFSRTFHQADEIICTTEIWRRDSVDHDLWHGDHGLIINSAALEERKDYYNIVIES
ncbi:MAG: hypothetical protein R2865_10395 [Deinococcales bacterium]